MAEELTNNFFDVVEDIFKKYEIANKGKELNKDLKTGTTLMSHSDFIPELASKYNLTEKETEDLIMIILDNQVIDDDIPYMVSRNTFKDGSNVADSVKKYINGEKIIIDKTNYFHPQHKIFGGTYQRKLPDTPTNVVDDINLTGATGGNTNVKGNNIAYVDVEELFPYVQYDRRTDTRGMPDDYIDIMKETIYEKGFMYDDANEGVNVFSVFFDDTGNVQVNEANHRLRALYEVAQETGQKIYVPIHPFITKIKGGNKVQNVSTTDAHNAMKQLIIDVLNGRKDTDYHIANKLGEPGSGVFGLEGWTQPGTSGGTTTSQTNIKKFFQSIGINAITYDELPDNNIYKTGVNTFTDTPGGSLGAAKLNDPLVFDSWVDNYAKTTTSFVDNLPLSTTVKNQFNNLVQGRARNLATPGGVADAVDVWELGVLGLMIAAVAYKEYDEIPTILKNKTVDMFNAVLAPYNIPPVPKEEYDLDYEFVNKVVETGEKFMPTDIIIKKVGDVVKGAAETGAVTGFGYVPPNLTKTDTMEATQKIQPGVQEEKMFKKAKPQKGSGAGSGVKIL